MPCLFYLYTAARERTMPGKLFDCQVIFIRLFGEIKQDSSISFCLKLNEFLVRFVDGNSYRAEGVESVSDLFVIIT